MRSLCLLTVALAATAAAHKDHDGLRGDDFGKKHGLWMEKYVTWLKQSLLEQNVQLTGEIFARSGVPGRSVVAEVVDNVIRVTCKSEQGAASTDKVALALRHRDSQERSPAIVVDCAKAPEYLSSGVGTIELNVQSAPTRLHAMLLIADAESKSYSVAARAHWGTWGHHGKEAQAGTDMAAISYPAEDRHSRKLSGPAAPSASRSPAPAAPTTGSGNGTAGTGSGTGSEERGPGLSADEKKAEEKLQQEESNAGLVIAAIGVGFIIYFSNKYAREAAKPKEEAHMIAH